MNKAHTPIHTASILLVLFGILPARGAEREDVSFTRDILPILSDRCFTCHGPDAENREAELRLDLESAAKKSVIVPGKPADSELLTRIKSADPDERMPPADSKLTLTAGEISKIERWIQQGAQWQGHWAFSAPGKIAVPELQNSQWVRNEIDAFVLRRLRQHALQPASVAARARLIRRVSFDLTGLPPTLAEIDDFLADSRPDAYERLLDRLLKSERFGERMAADWLDVARYSDTYGYQVDRDRFVWPWRDWVIRAFNKNMPYDEFVTQQLAGDLLPNATDDQVLATTFNRLHPQKVEGGSTPEEFRVEYVCDRTQTVATALLGLTMECCRCHDHKYDPISQANYYQLSAFFDNIDEAGLYSYFTNSVPTPTLLLVDDAQKQKRAEVEQRIAAAEKKLQTIRAGRKAAFAKWLSQPHTANIPGQVAHLDFEDHKDGANKSVAGRIGKAILLSGDDAVGLKTGNFRRFEPFSIALWLQAPDVKQRAVVYHRSRAWTDAGSRGYQLLIENGRLSASLIHFWPGNALSVRTQAPIPTKQWIHVCVTYDGSSRAAGLRLYLDGEPARQEMIRDNLYKNITGGGGNNIAIGERFRDRGFAQGLVDEFRVFSRELSPLEIEQIHDNQALTAALQAAGPAGARRQQSEQLYEFYLLTADPEYQAQLAVLRSVREERSKIVDGLPEIMVMQETQQPRPTYVLMRGAYDARGEQVQPETPAVLPAFPQDAPRNRLGLARWLTSSSHPLTARVAVNRSWQMMFGQGLVRTPEDFGRQGQPPTHPQLLDWLTRDFVEHGWDVKRLLKQIAMSATYRQSSQASSAIVAQDPENLWLARSAIYRLPAEMVRDHALAVSGLLVNRVGGAPARPYEVEVSFKPVKRDKGDGLYRRSLYTYWKRTGPAPVMMALDAAKRDVCRVRRERTSTPLQTFVLMNGPQFVEASRVLAQRLLEQHGDNTDALLTDMFRTLTSRRPAQQELAVLRKLHAQQQTYFAQDPARAEKYLATGDSAASEKLNKVQLAAAASVANALFDYDEAVMKR